MKRRIAAIIVLGALAAPAPAAALPDLTISLPQEPTLTQVAPVYLDAYQEPGHLLYRFDALLHNEGTTLDLYRDPDTGHAMQALWDGDPTVAPDPATAPTGVALSDRSAVGAKIEFVTEQTHAHFHFFTAARYELLVPGDKPRVSGKIGFCLFDSFDDAGGPVQWFEPFRPWCHGTIARMGLSPGAADRYSSQREFQYVDVTGLAAGDYTLRGVANPEGHVLESDGVPDVREEPRFVPGVIADPAEASAAGAAVSIPLAAWSVGRDIPARRSASCMPTGTETDCYVWAQAGDPLRFAVTPPAHGTATVDGARVSYAPAAGFVGDDRFTFTATDARGLVSRPATVVVHVAAAPPAAAGPRRLLAIVSARRAARRRVSVRIRCLPVAAGACTGRVKLRAGGRAIGSRRFAALRPGRARTLRIRLSRVPRRVIRVRATVADATGRGSTRHAVVKVHHAARKAAL